MPTFTLPYFGTPPYYSGTAVSGLVPAVCAMVTDGTSVFATTIVIELDVTGFGLAQGAVDVRMQVITALLVLLVVVYTALFVPTFAPFRFH